MNGNTVTCSLSLDKDVYDEYKSLFASDGEDLGESIERFMKDAIKYETPNLETIQAIKEVEELKATPNKKTYNSFAEIMREAENAKI